MESLDPIFIEDKINQMLPWENVLKYYISKTELYTRCWKSGKAAAT